MDNIDLSNMPELPEVIVDGHKVAGGSREAMSEVYEILNMSNIAKMRKLLADQASQGWVMPYNNLTVFPAGQEITLDRPGQDFTLVNDGPAAIQVGINSRLLLQTVLLNGAYNINFGNHTLKWFFLICGPGLTATIRASVKG